ncbi:hypothetical protein ACIBEJ_47075 [Nonomuraea sp. NPDC050790]|uniref:hypothetical protein n=1 Tax=Nonomuraea sp. NPDC050790 TaxID=3364371 RepID=UPI0037ACC55B
MVLRVLTMAGYPPALLFFADSFTYLREPVPGTFRPAGYSIFLHLLRPVHSLALVTAVQHLLGLALAVSVYALLRRRGLPGWGATLVVGPLLFDEFLILMEHMVMADALFAALVTGGVLALLTGRYGTAGLLLAAAALTRTIGLPVLVLGVAYLALRRAGRRPVLRLAAAGLAPLLAYSAWAFAETGSPSLTRADGMFLWSRTMTFADCRVIRPADTRLCPTQPAGERAAPPFWMWGGTLNRIPVKERNAVAGRFAREAIVAQPGAYLAAVGRDLGELLRWERTSARVVPGKRNPYQFPREERPVKDRAPGIYERGPVGTRLVEPYAGWLRAYQRFGYLPYPLLTLGLLGSLAAAAVRRRPEALLPGLAAVVLVALPPFVSGYDVRYVLTAMPLTCLAIGMVTFPINLDRGLPRKRSSLVSTPRSDHRPGPRHRAAPAGRPGLPPVAAVLRRLLRLPA